MNKYICEYDETYGDFIVSEDDPGYDGPETNIADDVYTYHITASTPDAAKEIARFHKSIDDGDIEVNDDFDRESF